MNENNQEINNIVVMSKLGFTCDEMDSWLMDGTKPTYWIDDIVDILGRKTGVKMSQEEIEGLEEVFTITDYDNPKFIIEYKVNDTRGTLIA